MAAARSLLLGLSGGLLIVGASLWGPPASDSGVAGVSASSDSGEACGEESQHEFCGGWGQAEDGQPTNDSGGSEQSIEVDLPPLTYRIALDEDADGDCVIFVAQWVEEPTSAVFTPEQVADIRATLGEGDDWYDPTIDAAYPAFGVLSLPLCEHDGDAVDLEGLAQQVWVGLQIESPDTHIAPGYMLTGLTSYLELDAPAELVATEALPDGLGTLTITATPEHHIDWDDGDAVTVTTSTGVGYPGGEGEITHVYTDAAERTVQVVTHWTGTFSGPGFTDEPLGVRVAEPTVLPLEVREWQAVRTGGSR